MKCLEKDRTRRYETANGLATDLKRHLANEPVVARPPSTTYRFQKTVRRNKLAFAAGTAVLAALLIGFGFSMWSFFGERLARAEAEKARAGESVHRQRAEEAGKREARLRDQAEIQE